MCEHIGQSPEPRQRTTPITPTEVLEITAPIEDPEGYKSRPYLTRDPTTVSLKELEGLSGSELNDYAIAAQTLVVCAGDPWMFGHQANRPRSDSSLPEIP